MDIRFLAIIALVAALMEILGRLARKRGVTEAPDDLDAPRMDPFARAVEELERRAGEQEAVAEPMTEVGEPKRTPSRAVEPVSPPRHVVEPVPPPRPGVEPPVWPRPARETPEPPRRTEEVVVYRDRAPRPIVIRSREARPVERRVTVSPRRSEEASVPAASKRAVEVAASREEGRERHGVGEGVLTGGLGLSSVSGLRRLVVAREVLGPPLALRDGEQR